MPFALRGVRTPRNPLAQRTPPTQAGSSSSSGSSGCLKTLERFQSPISVVGYCVLTISRGQTRVGVWWPQTRWSRLVPKVCGSNVEELGARSRSRVLCSRTEVVFGGSGADVVASGAGCCDRRSRFVPVPDRA